MKPLQRNKYDLYLYDREIGPYLPERIFDAHCHLFNTTFHKRDKISDTDNPDPFFYDVTMDHMERSWKTLLPDSSVNGLIMGFPDVECDHEAENRYIAHSITDNRNRFSLMTKPQKSLKDLEGEIRKYKPFGLKPYLVYALVKDKQQARITDFISEEQLDLANKYGLGITLHVSKPRGMADPNNLSDIARLVKQYPKVQFILAHCGRSFIAPNMAVALDDLPVAENLWLDTSAVCDTGVFLELFSRYDHSRLLFGSDLVNAVAFRGSYVGLGMNWHLATPEFLAQTGRSENKATFAMYENLRAIFQAVRFCSINKEAIRNIFYNNAARLFGL